MSQTTILIIFCLFSVAVNVRVFCVVMAAARKKIRPGPVPILVVHLACVTICSTIVEALYRLEIWKLANLDWPGICKLRSFFGHMMTCAFTMNVVSIVSVCISSPHSKPGHSIVAKILRLMTFIWIPAGIVSIPINFMYKFEPGTGGCKPVAASNTPLLGSLILTTIFEVFRFILFNLSVVGYMIYAVFKIRTKLRYLNMLPSNLNQKRRRRVQKIRFIFVHSIVFSLLWIPVGLVTLTYRILRLIDSPLFKVAAKLTALANLIFFLLSPLIYVSFLEDISAAQFLLGRALWTRFRRASNRLPNEGIIEAFTGSYVGRAVSENQMEMSRISTVRKSGTSAAISHTSTGLNRKAPVICVTGPTTPPRHSLSDGASPQL